MKTILQETAAEVVDLSTRKHQYWFDEADKEIQELLEKKRSCHNRLLAVAKPDDRAAKTAYKTACCTIQAQLRTMQNNWCTALAERTQRYADMDDMGAFYEALKTVYRPSQKNQAPLCSSDRSSLLTDEEAILQRWSDYFEGLFSDQRTMQESSLAKIPRADVELKIDEPPTRKEIKKATMHLKVGKSHGIDGILAEVYQHGEYAALSKLQDLSTNC